MYIRFIKIVASPQALGRELFNSEKVNKILCRQIDSFDAKIIVIYQSEYLDIYIFNNMLDSLIAYEQNVIQ